MSNLAWSCPHCNLRKSNKIEAFDIVSEGRASLFHPRTQSWSEHFVWDGFEVEGLTPTGRATISALDLNAPRRLTIRRAEAALGFSHFDAETTS